MDEVIANLSEYLRRMLYKTIFEEPGLPGQDAWDELIWS